MDLEFTSDVAVEQPLFGVDPIILYGAIGGMVADAGLLQPPDEQALEVEQPVPRARRRPEELAVGRIPVQEGPKPGCYLRLGSPTSSTRTIAFFRLAWTTPKSAT